MKNDELIVLTIYAWKALIIAENSIIIGCSRLIRNEKRARAEFGWDGNVKHECVCMR